MGICDMCRAIPTEPFFNLDVSTSLHVHHPSVKSLETSSMNGCRICALFYSAIAATQCRNEGHKTYLKVDRKLGVSGLHQNLISYQVGRDGQSYFFDIETTGTGNPF